MSAEELFRREMELREFHNPKKWIRQAANECRERKMTYRLSPKKKAWITRLAAVFQPGMMRK